MCLRKAECRGVASLQDFDHKTMVTQIKKTQQENEAADMWASEAAARFLVAAKGKCTLTV